MMEIKIILSFIVRKFEFKEAYEELHRISGRKGPIPEIERAGGRAYQVLFTASQPKDGLPVWVKNKDIAGQHVATHFWVIGDSMSLFSQI
jgi:hypothetical protein